jgi:hypothetical protein
MIQSKEIDSLKVELYDILNNNFDTTQIAFSLFILLSCFVPFFFVYVRVCKAYYADDVVSCV